MKKFFLLVFLLVDLALVAGALMFLIQHIKTGKTTMSLPGSGMTLFKPGASASATQVPVTSTATVGGAMAPSTRPANVATRKYFTYRNSHAKHVMIRGDFTNPNWHEEPMTYDKAKQVWVYSAMLEPGEYGYLFFVDGKPTRDPNNKRTKLVGKTPVSVLVVSSTPSAPH